ncbi:peptidoglycan-binding protein [Streptomyces sp. A012304]|uniref:peptidoglycan-binding protein n=1 Tax=Streptomyces sp. A012304 TaxID=375446 RepID=UPI00222E4D21|nr:peptidoglycan-binding protein [Streptomyces sp. A012304]
MNGPTGWQGRPGQHGLPCPECGALRAADNTPSCACAQRASEALRDTREAEAAAAGDFDPLRIRPYVELGEGDGTASGAATGESPVGAASGVTTGESPTGEARASAGDMRSSAGDVTMPLPAVPSSGPSGPRPAPGGADDRTAVLPAVTAPFAPSAAEPNTADLRRFEAGGGGRHPDLGDEAEPRGRRRRTLLLAATGAVVAVVAAAGFASGLFSYEKPTRDTAAPEDVRAAVPDTSPSASSASPSASRSPSPAELSASPSPSESESASPSPSPSSAAPSPSRSAEPSPSAPTPRATGSLSPENGADTILPGPQETVLRRGDRGSEVTELQLRLSQLFLYDDKADGEFTEELESALRNYQWSRGIQDDEPGVYGAVTRERLESETKEP